MQFLKRLSGVTVLNRRGTAVTGRNVVDHEKAYSIYFCDPYGHSLEVTTYDYDAVTQLLDEVRVADEPTS